MPCLSLTANLSRTQASWLAIACYLGTVPCTIAQKLARRRTHAPSATFVVIAVTSSLVLLLGDDFTLKFSSIGLGKELDAPLNIVMSYRAPYQKLSTVPVFANMQFEVSSFSLVQDGTRNVMKILV